MNKILTIEELENLFEPHRVSILYVKHLALKQDNEKNQIYLGRGLDGVTNLFPAKISERSASESLLKPKSTKGKPKLEARIDFSWLKRDGSLYPAPNTRIIDYFQYPEVRMSGFLKKCGGAPNSVRRRNQAEYGKRILVLGVNPNGQVIGIVLTKREDPLVDKFPSLPNLTAESVLKVWVVGRSTKNTPLKLLKIDLTKVIQGGWYSSRILKPGAVDAIPFEGTQGGGYTLEALLGVSANADKAPDLYGFEVKSYSKSRISLMTPTPDGGFQGENTFKEFMDLYGRPAAKADGSIRFTGTHKCGAINKKTNMTLNILGYNSKNDRFGEDTGGISGQLVYVPTNVVVASWSLGHLANSWNSKHALAVYVQTQKRVDLDTGENKTMYSYGPNFVIGEGTDVWRLLRAIASGIVFYDPGDSIYITGKAKHRPQWRINGGRLRETISILYYAHQEFEILG